MLTINVNSREDNVVIVNLAGEFRIEVIGDVEAVWNESIREKPRVVAFDCTEMEYIDSSSIGSLVKFVNTARNRKFDFILYGLNSDVYRIFQTARLQNFFGIISKTDFEIRFPLRKQGQ